MQINFSSKNFSEMHKTRALVRYFLQCVENYPILFAFSEEAFRPGWDRFEDFLVYGLIILGKYLQINQNLKHNKLFLHTYHAFYQ